MEFSEQKSVKERVQNETYTMYLTHGEGKRTLVSIAKRKQELLLKRGSTDAGIVGPQKEWHY